VVVKERETFERFVAGDGIKAEDFRKRSPRGENMTLKTGNKDYLQMTQITQIF